MQAPMAYFKVLLHYLPQANDEIHTNSTKIAIPKQDSNTESPKQEGGLHCSGANPVP
jgi:hypothetical protein